MSDNEKLIISANELRGLVSLAAHRPFVLGQHFNEDNIVEIAKSQFPRLEAQVAMHAEMQKTKRLLIWIAAVCFIAGSSLVVFSPAGKEGVSYVVSAAMCILSLGAVGIQEFRLRTIGVNIEGGTHAVSAGSGKPPLEVGGRRNPH